MKAIFLPLLGAAALLAPEAQARTICTVVADAASDRVLRQEGDCATRVTPASTFKIALALMGFDSGFLKDEHAPTLPYRKGDPAWGGAEWKKPTDATRWIRYSVVWFSQKVAHALGQERFRNYAKAFDYGNADVSGKPAYPDGMTGAWINSTLRISPLEQVAFLKKLVNRRLPVSAHAFDMTERVTTMEPTVEGWPAGWELHGKTGSGSPGSTGKYDAAHAYGWFVGWARHGDDKVVFARLIQDDRKETPSAGYRARDSLLRDLPGILAAR